MTPSPKGRKKPTALDRAIKDVEQWGCGRYDRMLLRVLKAARRDRARLAKYKIALQDAIDSVRGCAKTGSIKGTGVFYLLKNSQDWAAAIRQSREK